jgi:hypothetical protein
VYYDPLPASHVLPVHLKVLSLEMCDLILKILIHISYSGLIIYPKQIGAE